MAIARTDCLRLRCLLVWDMPEADTKARWEMRSLLISVSTFSSDSCPDWNCFLNRGLLCIPTVWRFPKEATGEVGSLLSRGISESHTISLRENMPKRTHTHGLSSRRQECSSRTLPSSGT